MRNYKNLKAFQFADELALMVYAATKTFPRDELFGLTNQLRRAAVSVASNIVEGSARKSKADYVHFLFMAYGSSCEIEYQLSLAFRLGYLDQTHYEPLHAKSIETSKTLNGLIRSLQTVPDA